MSGVRIGLAAALVALAVLPAVPADAEPFADLFSGTASTGSSDLHVRQPAQGNDYVFHAVRFQEGDFTASPWWGVRGGYFFETYPWLGLGVEYFHFTMVADTGETRPLTGTRGGASIDTAARLDSIVQQFQITHGVNYFMADVLLRYPLLVDPERFPHGRVQPYGGLGIGAVVTHAESRIEGVSKEGYEVGGLGFQAFLGARVILARYLGLFVEYKFTHSRPTVSVAGGDATVTESTHHLVGGITIPFSGF